ncbi:glycosyltransferase family 32 protein [Corallococcus sp. CA041A]|uniref:glycosyltransferase family 32 protein n=1 Tax=Corallococcus sp. CA041A TaxID=2316727 RepID=UPI0013151752|nr:glycosyltransferase [Corallococcus sp. CA041A]
MRHLTRILSGSAGSASTDSIPRVIVQFWDSPSEIPIDVLECMKSWATLEPLGFRREVYGDESARSFIESRYDDVYLAAFDACPHPAMRSDYFRLCYLAKNGGMYVDADDVYQGADWTPLFRDSRLRLQALCYDSATDTMVDPSHAISVDDAPVSWIHYVNNTPIIAPARHPVLLEALQASTAAICGHRGGPLDIQSMTGPGNLTVALANYAIEQERLRLPIDVEILCDWETIAVTQWPLSYRNDARNWRLWRQDK